MKMNKETVLRLLESGEIFDIDAMQLFKAARVFEIHEEEFIAENGKNMAQQRIAIVSASTVIFLPQFLKLFLYAMGIKPYFYVAPFNTIFHETLNYNSGLYTEEKLKKLNEKLNQIKKEK